MGEMYVFNNIQAWPVRREKIATSESKAKYRYALRKLVFMRPYQLRAGHYYYHHAMEIIMISCKHLNQDVVFGKGILRSGLVGIVCTLRYFVPLYPSKVGLGRSR